MVMHLVILRQSGGGLLGISKLGIFERLCEETKATGTPISRSMGDRPMLLINL